MYRISKTNRSEAFHATRAILDLYKEAITIHGGIRRNQFAYEFDAFQFLQCEIDGVYADTNDVDVDLLRQGAAIALLCRLLDTFGEAGETLPQSLFTEKISRLLTSNAFENAPLAKDAILFAFIDRDLFITKLELVYEEYILGYFYRIIDAHNQNKAVVFSPIRLS